MVVAYFNGNKPTLNRWSSFLQNLTLIQGHDPVRELIRPEKWFTMKRRRSGDLEKELLKDRKDPYGNPLRIEIQI